MNAPTFDLLEPLLRAATAALSCLMAAQFARLRPWRVGNVAGILFGAAIAAYAIVSSPQLSPATGPVREPLIFLATFTAAFFWVFALALFRDDLRWRWSYATPFLLLLLFYVLRRGLGERTVGTLGHQVTVVVLLLHVLSIAVREFHNDLMDSRRRFRLVVALVLPAVGLVIAAAETYALFRPLPGWIGLLQASALLALAAAFALWLTAIKPDIMVQPDAPRQRPEMLSAAEAIELERLQAAIAGGICLEPLEGRGQGRDHDLVHRIMPFRTCRQAEASGAPAAPSHQQGAGLPELLGVPERSPCNPRQAYSRRSGELSRADRRGRLRARICVPCPVQPGVPPVDRHDAVGISRPGACQDRR